MNILIVEDEPKSREGIIHIIRNYTDYQIIGVASNGEEGVRFAKERKPDLIISDIRMPTMSGIDMLQTIKQGGIDIPTIFLTGYSEFSYAYSALKLQAVDYILKPIEVEKLLETLSKIESKLKEKKNQSYTVEQLLYHCIHSQEIEGKNERQLENQLSMNDTTKNTLLYIQISSYMTETMGEMIYHIKQSLEAHCFDEYYVLSFPNESAILVLMLDTEKNVFLKRILEERVVKTLLEIGDFLCSYQTMTGMKGLKHTVDLLKTLLQYGFHLKKGTLIDTELVQKIQYETIEYPIKLETDLQKAILKQNKEHIYEIGTKFCENIIEGNYDPDEIKEYTVRFVASVTKANVTSSSKNNESFYHFSHFIQCQTSYELVYQFQKILHKIVGQFEKITITENDIVLKAIAFIREHYKEDISLSEISDICNVSQEYLSRLFQQETGIKFVYFLQNFRISMAKRLLLSSKNKIYEIAEEVGYHDQKYFVSVFKKIVGMTPSEYRKENEL